jgi:hypothetical protein
MHLTSGGTAALSLSADGKTLANRFGKPVQPGPAIAIPGSSQPITAGNAMQNISSAAKGKGASYPASASSAGHAAITGQAITAERASPKAIVGVRMRQLPSGFRPVYD